MTFRALLIDPVEHSITTVDIDGSAKGIEALIGCELLDQFRLSDHDATWCYGFVDDAGLSRGEPVHAFLFDIRSDPIAGRCVIAGLDKISGDICDCDAEMTATFLRDHIEWLGLIKPEVTWDRTPTGDRAIVTYARVRA